MNINKITNYNISNLSFNGSRKINLSSNFFDKGYKPAFNSKTLQVNKDIFEDFEKFEKPFISPMFLLFDKKKLNHNIFKNFPSSDIENIQESSFNKYAAQLYEEVCEIVKKQNPMFNELNIPIPELKVVPYLKAPIDVSALYSFHSNTIEIEEKTFKDDYYVCYVINNSGNRIPIGVCKKDDLDKFKSEFNQKNSGYKQIETTKLTEQEKKLWIESTLAHELRHCLQSHIEASVGTSNKYLAKEIKLAENVIQEQKNMAELLKRRLDLCSPNEYNKYKIEYDKTLENIEKNKKDFSYILNFKPNKILDSDTKLKFSINPDDNRYWSVAEHLIKSSLKYTNKNDKIYFNSPTEIDAYNYQMEFIFSQSKDNKYRNDSILAMGIALKYNYENSLINLKKNGFKDLIKESK